MEVGGGGGGGWTRSPAKVDNFSLSKMTFSSILIHVEHLTDFRKTLETGLDPRLLVAVPLPLIR